MRLHSAPVLRVADAKPMHLGHVHTADGRWRIYLFAPADGLGPGSRAAAWCDAVAPIVARSAPAGGDLDAVVDVRAVTQASWQDLEVGDVPPLLRPTTGRLGLTDYEKVFSSVTPTGDDVYDLRGVSREEGAVVVVRPDQYVAHVLPLDATDELGEFFARFTTQR